MRELRFLFDSLGIFPMSFRINRSELFYQMIINLKAWEFSHALRTTNLADWEFFFQ